MNSLKNRNRINYKELYWIQLFLKGFKIKLNKTRIPTQNNHYIGILIL